MPTMNKLILPEGHEIRVELIRLYPGQEEHRILAQLKEEVRQVTNHIVRGREDVKNARKAYALKHGIGGHPPELPASPKLPTPTTPEEKKAVKEAWRLHKVEVRKVLSAGGWLRWYKAVSEALEDCEQFAWRKNKYQDLRRIYRRVGTAVLYRDTAKRLAKTKGANYKRPNDHIPLVWGNSSLPETGEFYGTRRGNPFYNAKIKVNGMTLLGRLRRPLPGKVIQGVTLTQKADGWYAAVKCIVPKRILPEPVTTAVGIDMGQTDIVAFVDTDGRKYTQPNERTLKQRDEIAKLQSKADLSEDKELIQQTRRKIARLHLAATRRIKHWLNADLLPRLARYATVVVEKLPKNFKSNSGPLSCMHAVLDAIKQRLGGRVREVQCSYTSQECSHCHNIAKESRKGKNYACVAEGCGYTDDADVNAARNILRKGLILQAA